MLLEVCKIERQPGHRHARDAAVAVAGEIGETLAIRWREILEKHQRRLQRSGDLAKHRVEGRRRPCLVRGVERLDPANARRRADHQHAHREAAWKNAPRRRRRRAQGAAGCHHEILIDHEKGLERPRAPFAILEEQPVVLEAALERLRQHDLSAKARRGPRSPFSARDFLER